MKKIIASIMLGITFFLGSNGELSADVKKGWEAFNRGDYSIALREWRSQAELGDAEAQLSLGTLYRRGLGVSQDLKKYFEWTQLSAEQGNAIAMHNLGVAYYRGDGVARDDVEGAKWLFLSLERGRSNALDWLKVMVKDASIQEINQTEILKMLSEIATNEVLNEMCFAAAEAENYRLARNYCEISAQKNDAWAHYMLGRLYRRGQGVPIDNDLAYSYFVRAYDLGYEQAIIDADKVRPNDGSPRGRFAEWWRGLDEDATLAFKCESYVRAGSNWIRAQEYGPIASQTLAEYVSADNSIVRTNAVFDLLQQFKCDIGGWTVHKNLLKFKGPFGMYQGTQSGSGFIVTDGRGGYFAVK